MFFALNNALNQICVIKTIHYHVTKSFLTTIYSGLKAWALIEAQFIATCWHKIEEGLDTLKQLKTVMLK